MKKKTFLCDQKFIHYLAEELELKSPTHGSILTILNHTELKMTSIILQAVKFANLLKRDKIILEDINIILDSSNNQNLCLGKDW